MASAKMECQKVWYAIVMDHFCCGNEKVTQLTKNDFNTPLEH